WTEEDLERAKNKILKENWEANKPKLNEAISAETTGDLMALWSSQAAKEKPKSTSSDSDENPSRSAAEPLIPKIGDKESEIALGLGNILLKNQGNRDYKKMIHWILDGNHDLWYDRTTRNILVAKKGTIPLGDSYSGPRYEFIKLTKEAYKKLVNNPDGERQLVNANNPIYKRGKYTNLSAMLDYKILNKDEYTDPYLSTTTITFDLEVSYKVGKFVFNGEPLVSDKANKSIINIEYTFTKDGEEEGDEEEIDGDDEEVTPPNDDGDLSPTNPTEPSDPEPEPAPEPEIPESPSLGSGLFKLGHWNILNFTGDDKKQKDKTKRIAILSEKEKFDILGLTEVKNPEGVKKIVDEMNKLSHSNMYSYIASKKEAGSTFNAGSAEAVAIIYNNKKFEPIEFKNGKKGYSYKELFTDFLGEDNAEYARPPYGVQFKYKPKPEKKLTFVFNHFDGPGAKKGEIIKDGLGTFEYREAKQLENVLKEFENLSDDGENIFFGGDTNIILGKEKLAFDWLKKHGGDSGYESVFDDAHRHRSSLGRKGENYTNPYDKIFYKSDFELVNKEVFDLYKVVKGKEFSDLFKKHGVEIKDTKSIWKGGVLSDHTYVTATFKIS
ncbi:endonuclease/exonuclease/phosphatase family protein, partial [Metamycoplasma auris]